MADTNLTGAALDAIARGEPPALAKRAAERAAILAGILGQLERAYAKHGREPWGRHEFYGILLEEVDELWDAIKGDEPLEHVIAETLQVAAMCVRYLETGDRYGFTGDPDR